MLKKFRLFIKINYFLLICGLFHEAEKFNYQIKLVLSHICAKFNIHGLKIIENGFLGVVSSYLFAWGCIYLRRA